MKIIYDSGLCLKLKKYVFMQDEVVYLGFRIKKNSIFPVKEKTDAIPIANVASCTVINRLRCAFCIHGIQYFIISDNVPSLTSQKFNTFL